MRHAVERLADILVGKMVPKTTAEANDRCDPWCEPDPPNPCCGCNNCPQGMSLVRCINSACQTYYACDIHWQCL